MPIEASLSCDRAGKLVDLLMQSPSLAASLACTDEHDVRVHVDIFPLLLVKDLYGKAHTAPLADSAVWAAAATANVLSEADLGPLEHAGYVGTWNRRFLGWLMLMSQAAGEKVEIDYFHERGDFPMEYAWWRSDPNSPDDEVEVFGLEIQDADPQWRREVIRHSDGRLEVRGGEWPYGMHRGGEPFC